MGVCGWQEAEGQSRRVGHLVGMCGVRCGCGTAGDMGRKAGGQ